MQQWATKHPEDLAIVVRAARDQRWLTWADWWWVQERIDTSTTTGKIVIQLFLEAFGTLEFPYDRDPRDVMRSVPCWLEWFVLDEPHYNPCFIAAVRHHADTLRAYRTIDCPQLTRVEWVDCLSRALLPREWMVWQDQCRHWQTEPQWRIVTTLVCAVAADDPAQYMSSDLWTRCRLYCHLVAWTTAQDEWLRAQWTLRAFEEDAVSGLRRYWQCVYRS